MAMKKVKEGDTVTIDGVTYRFGPTSTEYYNRWVDLVQRGFSRESGGAEMNIHLRTPDRQNGDSFHPNRIREALEDE